MSQVQKKRKIIEYSQDEDFFNDDLLEKLYQSEYQPDQTMSDYSPEDLTMSSAIEGFEPLKFSVFGNRAETDKKEQARLKKYEKTYGKEGAKVRNRIFKRILGKKQDGTKAGQWSARKAQSLTEDYEKAMSGKGKKPYKSSKRTKSQKSLKKWGDQDWKTKSGKKSSKTGERYLPAKAIEALSDKEYKKTSDKKRKDSKKGKQFSDQPKKIADKVAKYRADTFPKNNLCPVCVEYSSHALRHYAGQLMCNRCEKSAFLEKQKSDPAYVPYWRLGKYGKYLKIPEGTRIGEAENIKPHSVTISRSSNPQKKLMAVFEDSEGKKMKTTHFGQRGASDYTKHGDKERMKRYLERHGGGTTTSTKENWKDPTTAGALSRWILWNKPSLSSSFADYKRRFGLKGGIHWSKNLRAVKDGKSAEDSDPYDSISEEDILEPLKDNEMEIDMKGTGRFFRIARIDEFGYPNLSKKDIVKHKCASCASGNPAKYFVQCRYHDVPRYDMDKHYYCSQCMRHLVVDDEDFVCADCVDEKQRQAFYNPQGWLRQAEDWEDITDWEGHNPSIDPSPFEEVEWKQLAPPPSNIVVLMKAFDDAGYEILVVGGAVRDSLLGLEPKDYDLATNAKPNEVKEVVDGLAGYRYVLGPQAEKSILNLTSLVTVPNEKEAIEITTFRKELGYAGDRTKGQFIPANTFMEDAERRDLTINAMGMTYDGVLIDPMNGNEDLQKRVIRAVGNPTQRFVEDPLRMIRAIRFSTKYGMPIEDTTYQAIVENADLVTQLSSPRLRQEIGKVLVQPNGYKMLMETGILPILMPEFRDMEQYHHKLDYHPEDTLYNHYIEAFKKFNTIPNRTELGAWALLFHDIAKPQTADWNEEGGFHTFYGHDKQGAELVLENYNNQDGPFEFSKKELQAIAWTTDHHLGKFWEMKKPMKVSAMRNNENFPLLVEVITGDTMGIRRGGDEQLRKRLVEIDEITNKVNEQKAKTGNRPPGFAKQVIQTLNVQGKQISEALSEIEEMVSTGQVQSYDEALEVLKTKRNA